jgi:uncharacterized protein with von Willebrand factor type A (vWA) domain
MTAFEVTTSELAEQAMTWTQRARSLKISDQATYEIACEELRGIKGLRAKVEEVFGPIVKKAYEAHKEAVLQRKKADDPLNEAELILKRAIADWQLEQERIRREEQRRLEEEARHRQEEELEREIEQAEAEGASAAEVEAMIDRAPAPAPVMVAPRVAPMSGVATRELWAADVTDLMAFIKHVAAHPEHTALLMPNMTAINQMARALKSAMKIPGVRVYSQATVAVRR